MRIHPEARLGARRSSSATSSAATSASSSLSTSPSNTPSGHPTAVRSFSTAQDSAPNAATIYTIDLNAPEAAPVVLLDPATGDGWGGVKPVYSGLATDPGPATHTP